jgi:hypothetical protein
MIITTTVTGKVDDYGGYANLLEFGFTYREYINGTEKPGYYIAGSSIWPVSTINPITHIFTDTVTGLTIGKTYRFRAYAINEVGVKDSDETLIKDVGPIRELSGATITCYILKDGVVQNEFEIGSKPSGFNVTGETTINEETSFSNLDIIQTSVPPYNPGNNNIISTWNTQPYMLTYDTLNGKPPPVIEFKPLDYEQSSWTLTETAKYYCSMGPITASTSINAYFPYLWILSQYSPQQTQSSFLNGQFYTNASQTTSLTNGKLIKGKANQTFTMRPTSILKYLYLGYPAITPTNYGTNGKIIVGNDPELNLIDWVSSEVVTSVGLDSDWSYNYNIIKYTFSTYFNQTINFNLIFT